jgi:hypothetical protein
MVIDARSQPQVWISILAEGFDKQGIATLRQACLLRNKVESKGSGQA